MSPSTCLAASAALGAPLAPGLRARCIGAAATLLIVHGIDYMNRVLQASPAMQMPMRYLFLAVPVGGALTLVYLARPLEGRWWAGLAAVAVGSGSTTRFAMAPATWSAAVLRRPC